MAIQRLPGLGIYRAEDESRCFVDAELADVCKGREVVQFLEAPFDMVKNTAWLNAMNACDRPISTVAINFVLRRLEISHDARGIIRQAVAFLNGRTDMACARGDVAVVLLSGDVHLDIAFQVSEVNFGSSPVEFHTGMLPLSNMQFSHCLFDQIILNTDVGSNSLPYFDSCMIEQIGGRVSSDDLPRDRIFHSCDIGGFDSAATGSAIRAGKMSVGEKVLLITLRKLFVQSLSGRAENALYRGLDVDERRVVTEVLRLLKRHELAVEYSRSDGLIWLPVRKALTRVKRILSAPNESGEEVVRDCRALG